MSITFEALECNKELPIQFTVMWEDTELLEVETDCATWAKYIQLDAGVRYRLPRIFYGTPNNPKNPEGYYPLWCFVRRRVFPYERQNCSDLLQSMGMLRYNEWEIFKYMHGVFCTDKMWIKFKGENLTRMQILDILAEDEYQYFNRGLVPKKELFVGCER